MDIPTKIFFYKIKAIKMKRKIKQMIKSAAYGSGAGSQE